VEEAGVGWPPFLQGRGIADVDVRGEAAPPHPALQATFSPLGRRLERAAATVVFGNSERSAISLLLPSGEKVACRAG
jgi:hypothetical protein